ncbi:MAG: HIT family protein, partial [Lentisphaerae bacterium]|nr:HIT family protein [Lentisphaerota bacterium]
MNNCIFCKIVAGDVPCCKVYENDNVLAFLDIAPVTKGHTLVIPKMHCNPIMDTPADVLQQVILVVQKIARAQIKSLGASGINVTQANGEIAGQIVPHIHF